MFIYPHKFMLKTCGTTTLLNAVPKILEVASKEACLDVIDAVFYSRKAFLFPDKQDFPHGNWDSEVAFLDKIFLPRKLETAGYILGKVNPGSNDNWNLYVASPLGARDGAAEDDQEDITLEIMMLGLDEEKMKLFSKAAYKQPETVKSSDVYV